MSEESTKHYKKVLNENVFMCMEWAKQSYNDTMKMPVKKMQDYLSWKTKLEEEKQKLLEEQSNEANNTSKV